jgi:UDP-GlcNAc:undecaprenyl-phosphate/decaprenyl-phosphate GlcNAc-1-phosphate transferase
MTLPEMSVLFVVALGLGVGVPVVGMRMLAPSLAESERAAAVNFRGRRVFYGLGIVWLLWAGAAIVGGVAAAQFVGASVLSLLTLAGPLALVAFALGVVDDAYGSSSARGFRGHLSALRHGRLTTGGAKLLGISLASFVVALVIAEVAPWGRGAGSLGQTIARALVAGAAIALTSNLINLTDLRPGRALKVYTLLALAGVASALLLAPALGGPDGTSFMLFQAGGLMVFAIGPVLATWPFDLGERGMLGDAGANPMGAVAGLFIVAGLPLWALLVYALAIFALNLVSERVSFSRVIESNALLHRLDLMGRSGEVEPPRAEEGTGTPRTGAPE